LWAAIFQGEKMEEPNYEKIGGVIFGVQRLDMVMTFLTDWMAKRPAAEIEPLSASRIDSFASDGLAYFAQAGAKCGVVDKFDSVMRHLRFLAQNQDAMKSKRHMENVDEAVRACNEAHQLVAEIIDELGYAKHLPPAFMSERKITA
jgi:hypothetical protein